MYDDVTHGQSADQLVLPQCCWDAPPFLRMCKCSLQRLWKFTANMEKGYRTNWRWCCVMNFQNEKLKRHWAVGGYDFNLYYVDIRDIDWHSQPSDCRRSATQSVSPSSLSQLYPDWLPFTYKRFDQHCKNWADLQRLQNRSPLRHQK